ncbi:MAG: hypothetical protein GY751_26450 [Bacteroidetes bacterium]|nr:hypothetical protein [Bacteroidota bacterium]
MKIAFIGGYGHLGHGLYQLAKHNGHEAYKIGRSDSKSYLDVDLVVLTTPPSKTIFCLEEELDLKDDIPIISFVAGIPLETYTPHTVAGAVKAMTNIAAGDGKGFTVWAKDRDMPPRPLSRVYAFMDMLGKWHEVDDSNSTKSADSYLDDATALIGSGTAYAVQLIENFIRYGVSENLDRDMAQQWVAETFLSALYLMEQDDAESIVNSIASPNGTTAEGLEWLSSDKVDLSIHNALAVTGEKCRQLGENH